MRDQADATAGQAAGRAATAGMLVLGAGATVDPSTPITVSSGAVLDVSAQPLFLLASLKES